MAIQAVLFDVIGTTVMETPGTIHHCFLSAFDQHHIHVASDFIRANRGKEKREVINLLIKERNLPPDIGDSIYEEFIWQVKNNINSFSRAEGSEDTFEFLRHKKIAIGLGTGLSRELFEAILHHVHWRAASFEYTATSTEIPLGRPDPAMIIDLMKRLKISNPSDVIKVGDTLADIQEGRNAGVITAALLSGTQEKEVLEKEKPDFMLDSLKDLKKFALS